MKTHNGDILIKNKSDIQKLKGIEHITGYLKIYKTELSSLSGLESLKRIGGYLDIWYNATLTSLTGLVNLTSVGGNLIIIDNSALTSLTGLDNISSVGGDLEIYGNAALTSLTGLDNITSVGGDLQIIYNHALSYLTGLNITSVGGNVRIWDNAAHETIEFPYTNNIYNKLSKGNILKKNRNNKKYLILEKNLDRLKLFCFNNKTIVEIDKYRLLEYKNENS